MKRLSIILTFILFMAFTLFVEKPRACFGEKLGLGYLKGYEDEFSAHLIAIYIKEKTGIDSVINEFSDLDAAESSLKKEKTDIIILTGKNDGLDLKELEKEDEDCSFFTLIDGYGQKVILKVSDVRLADIKFFTLKKIMDRVDKIITPEDFEKWLFKVKEGEMFSKQAAREYLIEKDMI